MWSGPGLASGRGAASSELLFKGSRDWGGGGDNSILQSYIFFRMSLYFSILFTADVVFLFPVLYICLFTVWQGLMVPRVLTLNASGIPPKRYIKDGYAECLILNFNTITLLVKEGHRHFTVWTCLH